MKLQEKRSIHKDLENFKKEHNEIILAQLKVIESILKNQKDLTERVLILEANNEYVSKMLIKIEQDTSLTRRISIGVITTVLSAALLTILKNYFNLF